MARKTKAIKFKAIKHKRLLCDDQAKRIIIKFGGARKLMRAFEAIDPDHAPNASTIYRWTYPKEKGGTGGIIPTMVMMRLVKVARVYGIILHPEDLYPEKRFDNLFKHRIRVNDF